MRRWLYLSMALTVAAFGLSLYVRLCRWDEVPERVATHFGLNGQPDAWTPRDSLWAPFLMMPVFMTGMVVLTAVLPYLSPEKFKVDAFADVYGYVMFLVVALFAFIHGLLVLGPLYAGSDGAFTVRGLVCGMMLLFGLMGNVLGKVRRNFWMGVRTPWTLADARVWERTHRLAAWLFTLTGLVGFVLALLLPVSLLVVVYVGILASALIPVVYSAVLYKRLQHQGKLAEPAGPRDEAE